MIRDDMMEKLSSLWEDEAFVKALAAAGTDEDALRVLRENGVELTEEELRELQSARETSDELSEEDLEDVAGGFAIAALTAVTAMALGLYVYLQWRKWKRGGCGSRKK